MKYFACEGILFDAVKNAQIFKHYLRPSHGGNKLLTLLSNTFFGTFVIQIEVLHFPVILYLKNHQISNYHNLNIASVL